MTAPSLLGRVAEELDQDLRGEMQVTTYYLELRSFEEFTPSGTEVPDLEIRPYSCEVRPPI